MDVVRPLASSTVTVRSMAALRCRFSVRGSLLVATIETAERRTAARLAPLPGRVIESVPLRPSLQLLLGSAVAERTDTPRERTASTLFGSLIDTLRRAGPPGALNTTTLKRGRLPRKPWPLALALGGQPTTVTGAVTVALVPLWAPNVPVTVRCAPVQRFWLAVRMPCGPPSITSVNVDSGTSGSPLKTF